MSSSESRNYLAVWPSLFAASIAVMAFLPTLPLFLAEKFGLEDPAELQAWSGAVFAIAPFTSAIAGPFWGVLGDRYGRKPMALRATLGVTLVTWLMPFAPSLGWLLVMRAVQGALAGYVAPAMALGTLGVPARQHGVVIGRLQVAMALGLLLGPVIGAEVSAAFGRDAVFFFASGAAALSAIPVLVWAREDRSGMAERRSTDELRFVPMVRRLFGKPLLLGLLGCLLLMRFGQMMIEPYVALWIDLLGPLPWIEDLARDRSHAVDRTTAVAFGVMAIAQILFSARWGRLGDRYGPLRCLTVSSFAFGGFLILCGVWQTTLGFLMARAGAAVFLAGSMTLAYSAVSKRVAPAERSFAFAWVQSCIQLGLSLGPFLGGLLSRVTGIAGLFQVAAACVFASGFGMLYLRKRRPGAGDPSSSCVF